MIKKYLFLFLVWLVSFRAFSDPKIVFRNNCITQCASCEKGVNPDMATVFELTEHFPTGTTFSWDFGEPTAPGDKKNTATGVHQYCTPGTYSVKVTIQSPVVNTPPLVLTERVIIGQLPYIYLGKDTSEVKKTICLGQELVLNAFQKVGRPSYPIEVMWYPKGQTTDTIKVKESGCYSVKITEPLSGCSAEAKMQVDICGETDPNQVLLKAPPAWYFGSSAGVKFENPDNPTPTTGRINVPNGVAVMTDQTNSIIYYTDGQKVFDRDNNPITYTKDPATLINGDISNSQGVTTMPKTSCKGCQSEYYIFTLKKNAANENQIYYSIVDMKLNKGKGGLSVINQLLSPVPSTERFIASRGGTNFYWLISQDANSNTIRTFKVSDVGISAPIVTSPINATSVSNSAGYIKISTDTKNLAAVIPGPPSNKLDLFEFQASDKGIPTYLYTLNLGNSPPNVYGVEYSNNKNILYVSMQGDGKSVPSQILQFDLSSNNADSIMASKKVLLDTLAKIGALQIDPVNNTIIFVAIEGSSTLGKITRTNGLLSNSDPLTWATYEPNAVTFPPNVTSQLGLPPSIPSPPDASSPPSIKQSCEGTTFSYKVDKKLCDPMNNDKIVWKIYKSTLDPFPTSTGLTVPLNPAGTLYYSYEGDVMKHKFKDAGKYVITAAISNVCVKDFLLDAQEFDIQIMEPLSLKEEYNSICKDNAKVMLDKLPPQKTLTFEWSSKDKTSAIVVPKPGGTYEVVVTDTATGCSVTKKTQVNFLTNEYFFPKKDYFICMDEVNPQAILQIAGNSRDFTFAWSPNSAIVSPLNVNYAKINRNGNYQVEIKDADGCITSSTYTVPDKCEPLIFAPSIFTPNGDGKNDTFNPIPKNPARTQIVNVQIFNRWGEMLFSKQSSTSAELSWDGKFNGQLVPPDTYAWVIQYQSTPENFPEKGIITLRGAVVVAY